MKIRVFCGVMIACCAVVMLTGCGLFKKKPGKGHCISNLKQLGTLVQAYADDHRRVMPSPQALIRGKYLQNGALEDKKSCIYCPVCGEKYEFVIPEYTNLSDPGLLKDGATPNKVPMLRCAAHGYVVFLDGHFGEAPVEPK